MYFFWKRCSLLITNSRPGYLPWVIPSLKQHLRKYSHSETTGGFPRLTTHFQQPPKIYNNCSLLIMASTRGASFLDFPLLVPKNNPSLQLPQYFEGVGDCSSRSGGIWEASTALCLHVPAVALTLDTGRLGWKRKKDTQTHTLQVVKC